MIPYYKGDKSGKNSSYRNKALVENDKIGKPPKIYCLKRTWDDSLERSNIMFFVCLFVCLFFLSVTKTLLPASYVVYVTE